MGDTVKPPAIASALAPSLTVGVTAAEIGRRLGLFQQRPGLFTVIVLSALLISFIGSSISLRRIRLLLPEEYRDSLALVDVSLREESRVKEGGGPASQGRVNPGRMRG